MESVLEEARPEWAHVCPAFLTHGPSTNGRQASSLPRQILSRQTPTWAPRTLLCSLHSGAWAGAVGCPDSLTRGPFHCRAAV